MPTQQDVLDSLGAAADAARQAYMTALIANPGADLSGLYALEMRALRLWTEAEAKALRPDQAVAQAQADLDAQTQATRDALRTLKDVAAWMQTLTSLVGAATQAAGFFA